MLEVIKVVEVSWFLVFLLMFVMLGVYYWFGWYCVVGESCVVVYWVDDFVGFGLVL